jgi:hypothetical protein
MNRKKFSLFTAFLIIIASLTMAGSEGFNHDPDAQINRSLSGSVMFGYYIDINPIYPYIYFRDIDKPALNYATYNGEKQYWMWKNDKFDSSKIDLKQFFTKIDLTKTTLDRVEPVSETVYRDTVLEEKPYDYSNDKDFKDFMKWCDKTKVPADVKAFYLKAANNSAKRGNLIPDEGRGVSDNDMGIQAEAFKSLKYKNRQVPEIEARGMKKLAGGMQLYFEYRKRTMLRYNDESQNIFRENKTVPVTIVELEPEEGNTGQKILRGKALVKRVKADLEKTFHKKFNVKLKTMTISYTEFADCGKVAPLTHYGRFMSKYVHPNAVKNTLYIYYFTDTQKLLAIDNDGTHPLQFGPYGSDWENFSFTIIHEFGHSIGLRHHFNDTDGSDDIKTHISPACIMNYRYVSREFCPLCRYGLGIDK